jgi:predicted PurR-regulated permease PerM
MEQARSVGGSNKSSRAAIGLLAVALIVLAKYAQPVLLPVAVAIVLTFLFSPLVRRLRRVGVPDALGAAVVVFGFVLGLTVLASALSAPAATWWERAPQGIQKLIDRAEQWRLSVPFLAPARPPASARSPGPARVPATTTSVAPDPVKDKIASESVALTGALLLRLGSVGIFAAATLILLFFLLASERWLVSRTLEVVPNRRSRVAVIGAVRAAQRDIAAFLSTQALINAGVGLATGLACWVIGLPNPVLWGALAGIMGFVPYLGPFVILVTLVLAGALTFDTVAEMMLPALAFGAINVVESNFVTPWIIGRRLELSPLAVFLTVMLAGWLWGIAGAFIAVPFLVAVRSAARRSKALRIWAAYLDRGREEPPSMRYLLGLRRRQGKRIAVVVTDSAEASQSTPLRDARMQGRRWVGRRSSEPRSS